MTKALALARVCGGGRKPVSVPVYELPGLATGNLSGALRVAEATSTSMRTRSSVKSVPPAPSRLFEELESEAESGCAAKEATFLVRHVDAQAVTLAVNFLNHSERRVV